jgi:hypothetical protein
MALPREEFRAARRQPWSSPLISKYRFFSSLVSTLRDCTLVRRRRVLARNEPTANGADQLMS